MIRASILTFKVQLLETVLPRNWKDAWYHINEITFMTENNGRWTMGNILIRVTQLKVLSLVADGVPLS